LNMVLLALLALAIGGLAILALVIIGLVEAPWPLLLVGLLAALYGLQRLLSESYQSSSFLEASISTPAWQSESKPSNPVSDSTGPETAPKETSANEDVELVYRGIRYHLSTSEKSPPQPTQVDDEVGGMYRGQPWHRKVAKSNPASVHGEPGDEVVYRGHKVLPHHGLQDPDERPGT
jgi:hypothetical protein